MRSMRSMPNDNIPGFVCLSAKYASCNDNTYYVHENRVTGRYPQMIRLKRRLYGIDSTLKIL